MKEDKIRDTSAFGQTVIREYQAKSMAEMSRGGLNSGSSDMQARQIPEAFNRLTHHVSLLGEVMGMLENRLIPIVDQNGLNRPTAGCEANPVNHVCGLASSIRDTAEEIESLVERLQQLHNNIQL
jgi:hypothetical protein